MATNSKLSELEAKHMELIEKNNWKETNESKQLAKEYRELNLIIRETCYECDRLASITCQYH